LKYTEAGSAIHSEPAEKGQKKKTLVLTLGSPPAKGGKKNPGINLGPLAEKGGEQKNNNKTLVLTLGSLPKKGGKKKQKERPWY
jgi:hypothetical protein